MKLVGVVHEGQVNYFMWQIPRIITPSEGLVSLLESLPEGSEVGIERPEKEPEDITIDGFDISWKTSRQYWNPLVGVCQEQGFKIIYLDSSDVHDTMMEINMRQIGFLKEIKKLKADEEAGIQISDETKLDYSRKLFNIDIELLYAQQILRDEKLMENILKNPQMAVAIVGLGHSDPWIYDKLLKVDSYFHDKPTRPINEFDASAAFEHESPIYQRAELLENPEVDLDLVIEKESIQRKYSAVKTGRIFPDRKPDFIGTWDMEFPTNGLFELYILEKVGSNISGEIEDVNGKAIFKNGVLADDGKQIEFSKFYTSFCTQSSVIGEILFHATLENGEYKGEYQCREPQYRGQTGAFTMKPFSKE